jgi:hypothetical protein
MCSSYKTTITNTKLSALCAIICATKGEHIISVLLYYKYIYIYIYIFFFFFSFFLISIILCAHVYGVVRGKLMLYHGGIGQGNVASSYNNNYC